MARERSSFRKALQTIGKYGNWPGRKLGDLAWKLRPKAMGGDLLPREFSRPLAERQEASRQFREKASRAYRHEMSREAAIVRDWTPPAISRPIEKVAEAAGREQGRRDADPYDDPSLVWRTGPELAQRYYDQERRRQEGLRKSAEIIARRRNRRAKGL